VLEVPVAQLQPGDRARVLPGQAVPADGCVIAGQAEVDESMLTGEPMPVAKGPGDALVAGTVVHGSALEQEIRPWRAENAIGAHGGHAVAQARRSKAHSWSQGNAGPTVSAPVMFPSCRSSSCLRW